MREAFRSRDAVSVAKGVLMGRNSIDEDTAFAMLMARSEQDGTSLVEAARGIVGSTHRKGR
jgi:AmiR/NasT family two-component response regulator